MPRLAHLSIVGLAGALALGVSIGRPADAAQVTLPAFLGRFGQFPGPRPEHEYLHRFAGDWEFSAQATLPGGQSFELKGTCRSRMACGGTWLLIEANGDFMGMPYESIGLMGFDARNEKYVTTWVDAAKGFLDPMVGEVSEEGRLVSIGPIPNPGMPFQRIRARGTFIPEGEDSFLYVEEIDDGDGGWQPWLSSTYTRAKGNPADGDEHDR